MQTYIRTSYFLLLMMKKQGETLGHNATDDQIKDAKNKINRSFDLRGMPLDELDLLYQIFINDLPSQQNAQQEVFLPVYLPLETSIDQPQAINTNDSSPYTLIDSATLAINTLGIDFDLNTVKENLPSITYADLEWIRKERNPIFRRSEYGNTSTYQSIAHKIKEAIMERLYTLAPEDKKGEVTELSADDYAKFLPMMQKKCGRSIFSLFATKSESVVTTQFSRGPAPSNAPAETP